MSAAMMLRHSLDRPGLAFRVENAVQFALDDGHRTRDLGGTLTTKQMTEAIKTRLGD
ncbi:MAG: isocitrate/isopropylmalate family dehydrogenase [Myxococcota bacterium]